MSWTYFMHNFLVYASDSYFADLTEDISLSARKK